MIKIAIYPSNHGYGHATRMSALAQELNDIGVYTFIRTNRPAYLFNNLKQGLYSFSVSETDFGVVHGAQLCTEREDTRTRLIQLMNNRLDVIDREVQFLREKKIDLVLVDIPFLICEAASYAGIPVFAISNFDWHYIYKDIFEAYPEMRPVINTLYGLYSRVDMAYQLPFSSNESMQSFRNRTKVGLLARCKESYTDIRAVHELEPEKPILLAVNSGLNDIDMGLKEVSKHFAGYIISNDPDTGVPDAITIPQTADMIDYVYHADVILTKPGYSTLAEAVQFSKPLIIRPRGNYLEEDVLLAGLSKYPHSYIVDDSHRLDPDLCAFLKKVTVQKTNKVMPRFRNRNTEIAARIYSDYFAIKYQGSDLISVFDAGSNNLNYCVYDLATKRVLHNTQLPTGLGKGFIGGKLSKVRMHGFMRAFELLYAFDKGIISKKKIIATGVSRKAENIQELKDMLKAKHNLKYGVISARDEAYYVFSAIRSKIDEQVRAIAFDIGGNSTEFILTQMHKLENWISIPMGLLRLSNPDSSMEQIVRDFAQELERFPVDKVDALVGIGLTVEIVQSMLVENDPLSEKWGRLTRKDLISLEKTLTTSLNEADPAVLTNDPNLPYVLLSIKLMILFMDKYAVREILVCKDGINVGYAVARSSNTKG